jgi:prepilin-type N-terminal cleavage/methylation domain-containing protein
VRRGLTLVEVMVALVIAGLLAVGVAGTVGAAIDTRERLESRRLETRSRLAWRAVLTEALRGVRPPAAIGDTAFLLVDGVGPDGVPGDRLAFLTGGVLPPLNPGVDWVAELGSGSRGLRLMAAPVGVRAAPVLVPAPGGIIGLQAEARTADGRWLDAWIDTGSRPVAVRLTFWSASGPVHDPLTVAIPALEPPS